jgi:hypothetical protein
MIESEYLSRDYNLSKEELQFLLRGGNVCIQKSLLVKLTLTKFRLFMPRFAHKCNVELLLNYPDHYAKSPFILAATLGQPASPLFNFHILHKYFSLLTSISRG